MNILKAVWKALHELLSRNVMQGIGILVALLGIILGNTIWLKAIAVAILVIIVFVAIDRGVPGSIQRVVASIGRPSSIIMFILGATFIAIAMLFLLRPTTPFAVSPSPGPVTTEGARVTEQAARAATGVSTAILLVATATQPTKTTTSPTESPVLSTFTPEPTNTSVPSPLRSTPSESPAVAVLLEKGHETIQGPGTRSISMSANETIIGTADRFQDTLDQLYAPYTVFVIYGPLETKLSIYWGGWDYWGNPSSEFVEEQLRDKIAEVKRNHSTDYQTRGIRMLRCSGQISNCETTIVVSPTNDNSTSPMSETVGPCGPPINPGNVAQSLESGTWYIIEDFNNLASPKIHRFVVQQGPGKVAASSDRGQRAWPCPNRASAEVGAMDSAIGYKGQHKDEDVYGPDGAKIDS
jgi:hypothetical protein